jgi:hypothetical protein
LLPGDFKDALGLEALVWKALIVILIILSGAATIILFVWWAIWCIKYPAKTTEQIYEDIVRDLAEERERLAEIEAQHNIGSR